MIVKRNFSPIKVLRYVKAEMLFSFFITIFVFLINSINPEIAFPFSISAILGSALAIFIGFRNNISYSRWWEARTHWSGIHSSSRVLARLVISFANSHSHQPNYNKSRSESFKKDMIYKIIAWANALRLQLRRQENHHEIKPFFDDEEFLVVEKSLNKPNRIQQLIANKIYKAMAEGTLAGFDSFQMENQLLSLANHQAACEKIKNTPLLRQYDYFSRVFLYVFLFFLPFSLIGDFAKMQTNFWAAPVSIIVSFVFAIVAKVGEVNEDPFESKITDVPLCSICNFIERDLREMLEEEQLPSKIESENGFLM